MKRVSMLALFCFLISFLFSSPAPAQSVTGPQMVMTEKSHDFKEVDEGAVVEHSFNVTNRGNQVLEIKNVNPG
jgi:hypothetical protein